MNRSGYVTSITDNAGKMCSAIGPYATRRQAELPARHLTDLFDLSAIATHPRWSMQVTTEEHPRVSEGTAMHSENDDHSRPATSEVAMGLHTLIGRAT